MRIVCPNCKAAYEVPPALVGSTERPVRCARCATEWVPPEFAALPPPAPLPAEPVEVPAPPAPATILVAPDLVRTPPRVTPPAPEPGTRSRGPTIAVTLSALLLVALAAAAYAEQAPIRRAWPPSARLFDRIDGWTGRR